MNSGGAPELTRGEINQHADRNDHQRQREGEPERRARATLPFVCARSGSGRCRNTCTAPIGLNTVRVRFRSLKLAVDLWQ